MMRRQIAIFIAVIVFLLAAASGAPQANAKGSYLIYVGTYTGPTSKGIYAYRFNAVTGKSASLGLVAETTNPSFLAIDRTRRFLYAVNEISDYQGQKSGSVSAFAIDRKTGKLAFLNDVSSRGADPCYVTLDKSGKYVYVINEMGSTVTAFSYDAAHGTLREQQTISTLPKDFKGKNDTAEIEVHPNGKFLYGSNRGHDSIAVFAIGPKGMLKAVEYVSTEGKTPRSFAIDPTGSYLFAANQGSNKIVVFRIDSKTGHLRPTGQALEVPSPVCIKFVAID